MYAQRLGNIIIYFIKTYQFVVSPLFSPCCRFYPSCSEYAAQAVRVHGPLKGMSMALKRLLRCHPFCEGGYDPIK